ncbi:MAG: hypothetical protein ABL960_11640, partial [Nitrospira sp.]
LHRLAPLVRHHLVALVKPGYHLAHCPNFRSPLSGNDLVALKGEAIRTIQVKTTTDRIPAWPAEDKLYQLLAIVRLRGEGHNLFLDASDIYLIPKQSLDGLSRNWDSLSEFRITAAHVETLFQPSKGR